MVRKTRHLFGVLQLRLETDHVVERAQLVVLAQLHHGIGLFLRIVGIGQAARLHRSVTQRFRPALGHDFDRQAAVEVRGRGLPFLEVALLAIQQRADEAVILFAVHRAVDVVLAGAAGSHLVVARLEPGNIHVDALAVDDGRNGVEEGELVFAGQGADGRCERRRRQRPRGDDDIVPVLGRQSRDLAALHRHQRMAQQGVGDIIGEAVAVNRQGAAGRNLVAAGGGHDERAGASHLLVQESDGVLHLVIRAEGVRADEFGQALRLVGVGADGRAHFVQHDRHAGAGGLPGGLRSGHAAADDVDWLHGLPVSMGRSPLQSRTGERLRRFRSGHGQARVRRMSTVSDISAELDAIRAQSLWKTERPILGHQSSHIAVTGGREVLNFCANNYLGLADHPALVAAAKEALDSHGLGMASVRFICGTSDLHLALERRIAGYLGMDDAILFAACFDANGAVFEPLFGEQDAIVSDALNHASIIDGIRLSKAKRFRFANGDMDDLETQLKAARGAGARRLIIVTDGVFSMDGYFARLPEIRKLADAHDAMIMVDDCHATGFIGPQGRGTPARASVKVDILTGTFGKALSGSAGGYIAASQPIVDLMRQRARPYLFSNALPPPIVAASLKAIDLAEAGDDLRTRLFDNARRFRAGMAAAGFNLLPGEHPIIPVMLGEAKLAQDMAARLYELGVYVSGFFFPVVPKGQARIRTQMSAAHTPADVDRAISAFTSSARDLGVI